MGFILFVVAILTIFTIYLIVKFLKCYLLAKWITEHFGDEDDKAWWKKNIDGKG